MEFPEIELYIPDSCLPAKFIEPGCFHTEADELRWLKTRAEPLCRAAERALNDTTINPTAENFWAILGNDPPPTPLEVELQRAAEKKFAADYFHIVQAQRNATSAYIRSLNTRKAGAARKRTRDLKRKRDIGDSFPQPPRQRTRAELDDASFAARDKYKQDILQAREDERIWQQHLASEAGKARMIADGRIAQDWVDEENRRLVKLENDWQRVKQERTAEGLVPFLGPSPMQRARDDKKRLDELLKKCRDEETEKRNRVQARKDAAAAKQAADQAKLDAQQQKIATAKRKAEDQLPLSEQRALKRQRMYMAARDRQAQEIKRKKEDEEKKANAARLNRAINGPYVRGAQNHAQQVIPIASAQTTPPPTRRLSQATTSRSGRTPTLKPGTIPVTQGSRTPPEQPRPTTPTSKSPWVTPGSGTTTGFGTTPKSDTTAWMTPVGTPVDSLVKQTMVDAMNPIVEEPSMSSQGEAPPVPERPGSGVHLPGVKNQEELAAMGQQEQLKYVLDRKWPEVEGMPKCVQQEAVENRAASAGLSLEDYLREQGHASLTEYLKSQIMVIQKAPSELIEKHEELESTSLALIFNVLKDNLLAQARANGVSPLEWMRQLQDKDDPRVFTDVDDWLGEQAVYQAGFITGKTPEERKLALQGTVVKLSGLGSDIERLGRQGFQDVKYDEGYNRFCTL